MDLKEFTKQTLLQIVEGTNEASEAIGGFGAFIPYTNVNGNGKKCGLTMMRDVLDMSLKLTSMLLLLRQKQRVRMEEQV